MSESKYPQDLRYTKSHEWVRMTDQLAEVGITDFAQQQLSDITYVDLPEIGARFEVGEEVAVVESIKAASDIYAPISGEIAEINTALADSPEVINNDPYGNAWLFRIKPDNPDDVESLLTPAAYKALVSEEA
jgi:glycine cleavage system H protein